MATTSMFKYEAANAQGVLMRGTVEAADDLAAYRVLQAQGLLPMTIAAAMPLKNTAKKKMTFSIRTQAIAEMATLLRAGVAISEALPSLRKGHANTPLGVVFDDIYAKLRGGERFSDALAESKLALPPDVVQMIRAGDASGQLAAAMQKALDRMSFIESTRQELRNALIYPVVLVVSGVLAIVLIFALVVPKFHKLLAQGGDKVPLISRVVLDIGMFLHDHWLAALGIFGALLGLFWALLQQAPVRRAAEELVLNLPGVGSWLLQSEMGRWTNSLGALVSSQVPLAQSLTLSNDSVGVGSIKARLATVRAQVRAGERLTDSLERQNLIDPMGANLLRVGEQSGRLAEVLVSLTRVYHEGARQRMKRFMLLLEPVAILLIGGAIGTLMVAIMLAITSLNDIALQ